MNNDTEFKDKVVALYEYRQMMECPTMKCKSLQNTLLKESTTNSYELCLSISALLLLNNIAVTDEIVSDMAVLISKNIIKYSAKCAATSFEICQACAISKLMDKKDVQ
jgi:hypothetical protein